MQFLAHTLLSLLVLTLALLVFLQGTKGALAAALLIILLQKIKGFSLLAIMVTCAVLVVGFVAERLLRKPENKFLTGLAGSLVLLVFYGIFLGPLSSLAAWLTSSGLKLFPQMKEQPRMIVTWGITIFRSGLALSILCLGLYTVFAG
ncbi:MAG TPA: hypothetical protein VNU93_03090 [Verrucomicrobiae bacterium]|nr:hypothetical protein [Verrucomicrobiae bacterium]